MRKLIVPFAVFALAACSSHPNAAGGSDGGGPNVKTFALAPFTIPAGNEQINCYYVPADGVERYVSKFTVDMNAGSHHLVVFRIDERAAGAMPASGPVACTQIEVPSGFDGMLPGSQQLHSEVALPDGVGMKIEKYHGLYFQSHYINATTAAITTQVSYQLNTVDGALIQQTGGMLFYGNYALDIPPGMSVASKICHAPQDLKLVTATGHMHMHGLTFDATVGTENVFHTSNWDEPNGTVFPAPGMQVASGTPIAWQCAYNNTTSAPLVFGNSASKNEMCIFAGIYYPATNGATLLNCL